jgi:hypothetical protein
MALAEQRVVLVERKDAWLEAPMAASVVQSAQMMALMMAV